MPEKRTGKFVQMRRGDTEYIVFSPRGFDSFHANIVERFCVEEGIKGSYDSKRKRFVIHGSSWVIVGGGKFDVDRAKKSVRLYDNSMAYGRFEKKGLKEKIVQIEEFKGYEVSIE